MSKLYYAPQGYWSGVSDWDICTEFRTQSKKATIRSVASALGCSKSTVHHRIHHNIKFIYPGEYEYIKSQLDKNDAEKHIRGGLATKLKYKKSGVENDK